MATIGAFRTTGIIKTTYSLVISAVRDEFSALIVKELAK